MASWLEVVRAAFVAVLLFFSGQDSQESARNGAHVVTAADLKASNSSRRGLADSPPGSGFWSTKGSKFVDAAGRVVQFSGVQWSGFEVDGVPHGLDYRSYGSMLDQMVELGFNQLRLSFAGDTLGPNAYPWHPINYGLNPDLQGLNCLGIMDKIIDAASARGMKIILDYHRIHFTSSNEWGAWFDDTAPESYWINNWVMLAQRYKGNTAVLGADIFNEVHNSQPGLKPLPNKKDIVWGPSSYNRNYNFRVAAIKCAKAIMAVNQDWIIFVEGMWQNTWWGENLLFAKRYPMPALPVPNKLAYSAHEYGPYIFWQPYFNTSAFPRNLYPRFDKYFGFMVKQNKFPVWVGEWGGYYRGAPSAEMRIENMYLRHMAGYIKKHQLSHSWFDWGPDSKDTGGVLLDDWNTVDQNKMEIIREVLYPGFLPQSKRRRRMMM